MPLLELPEVTAAPGPIEEFIERLAAADFGAACNHYSDPVPGAPGRRQWLRRYLHARWDASILLVGEAAGWQGCRRSGIPFTSEHQVGSGPKKEPSATTVHRVLGELGAERLVLLWNACPAHPFRPGEPETNRPPSAAEIAAGRPFLDALARERTVVAVGKVAAALTGSGLCVRHPANGGVPAFTAGLGVVLDRLGVTA